MSNIHIGNQSLPIFMNRSITNPEFERQYEQQHLLIANPDDILVISTDLGKAYLNYVDSILGLPTLVHVHPREEVCLAKNLLADQNALEELKYLVYQQTVHWSEESLIFPFISTPEIDEIGKILGVEVFSRQEVVTRYNTKSGFRSLVQDLGLKVPDGLDHLGTKSSVVKAFRQLHASTCVVKLDADTGGMGLELVHSENELERTLESWGWPETNNGYVVVERWHEKQMSPSIQFSITPEGKIVPSPVIHQILNSATKSEYIGCQLPSPASNGCIKQIQEEANVIVEALHDFGLIGFVGFDAIVLPDNDILWIEGNLRLVATTFPMILGTRLLDIDPSELVMLSQSVGLPRVTTDAEVLNVLKPVLIREQGEDGVFPYNIGLLQWKKLDLVAFSQESPEHAAHLMQEAKDLLRNI